MASVKVYSRHVKLAARGPHAAPLLVLCGPNGTFHLAHFIYFSLNFE